MVKSLNRLGAWTPASLITISLVFLFAIYLAWLNENALAIAFASYGFILFQARLYLFRIISDFPTAPTLRRLFRSLVFFLPFIFLGLPTLKSLTWGIPVSIIYGGMFLVLQFSDLKFTLSSEFIAILPPISREEKFREAFHPFLGAIAQEYFYRGVLLYLLKDCIGFWAVIVTTLLFLAEHLMHFNASESFDKRDYLLQGLLSFGLGSIFFFSESLVGCMLGHVVYNSPGILQAFRRKLLMPDTVNNSLR